MQGTQRAPERVSCSARYYSSFKVLCQELNSCLGDPPITQKRQTGKEAVTVPCDKCSGRAVAQGSTGMSKSTLPVAIRESIIQEVTFALGLAG